MPLRFLCFLVLLFFQLAASAQCPPNIGFEQGGFANWNCSTGDVSNQSGTNVMTLTSTMPTAAHHGLMDSFEITNDPYGEFPVVCPFGGRFSVQLGNDGTGHEADGLSYTFTVPANMDTFTVTFFYAVVLQNPGHIPSEQPRFTVTARNDGTGTIVNCSDFDFVASGVIPGFKNSQVDATVVYKDWTPASLQFAGMAGQTITLDFRVSDCTRGGHFGYAYVDVSDNCTGKLATAPYCPAANALVLNAPYGFDTYTWYNHDFSQVVGNGQSVTLSPPPATSGHYWVSMIPYPGYGCPDTLKAEVTTFPVPPPPSVRDYHYCLNQISSPLVATALPGHILQWYPSATAAIGSTDAPSPPTNALGQKTYWVTQKQLFGCESQRVPVNVFIRGPFPLTFSVSNDTQCRAGNHFVFTNTSIPIGLSPYYFDFGDGMMAYAAPGQAVSYTYPLAGSYTARLVLRNTGSCNDTVDHPISVVPNPVAIIEGPLSICVGSVGATLSDSSLAPGSSISQWWWSVDGVVSTAAHPPLPASAPGPVPVALVVTTPEGCASDTARAILPVHNRPVAAFDFNGYCANEPLQLSDRSHQPPNTLGEQVSGWLWSADGAPLSNLQHPAVLLPAGTHVVRLLAKNNFGCLSDPADSLVVLAPQPRIALTIDDSCAGRAIAFNAQLVSGSVSDWRWNIGTGWFNGGMQVRQTFLQAGTRSLQLIATAPDGCRDTLRRSLNVYANRAFAGRDTMTAFGEPVQLDAHGDSASTYTWSPVDGLTDPAIANPIALWPADKRYELHSVDRFGCESRTSVLVKRYAGPDLYVPSAFTPNADGRNDRLRVRPVGIKTLHYFSLYNRNGELIYTSARSEDGWDGTYRGVALATQTLIYVTEGTDYRGQKVFRKGTVTLLR
ncbi:MAG: PKD domain-containing protein [Chitinophagaceae bacterium]|nr:MAG: PKD domain-containing protein [Chitinophagaceae bacterium]